MKHKKINQRARFLEFQGDFVLDSTVGDVETFKCCIATEQPVLVGEYYEILDIQSMDISRLLDSGPVLFDHDPANYVGVITECWKEGTELYAKFRFSNSSFAQQVKADLKDGILSKFSIGYYITSYKNSGKNKTDGLDLMRCESCATEFSIVTQPADTNCKLSRSKRDLQQEIKELNNNEREEMEELVKVINDLKAQIDELKASVDALKPVEKTPEEIESERKRAEEENKNKEEEEEEKQRSLDDEKTKEEAERKARELEAETDVNDQESIDKAIAEIAAEIADSTDAEVTVDDIISEIEKEINDVVDENLQDLESENV